MPTFVELVQQIVTIITPFDLAPIPDQDPNVEPMKIEYNTVRPKTRERYTALVAAFPDMPQETLRKLNALTRAGRNTDDVRLQFSVNNPIDNFALTLATSADYQAGLALLTAQGLDPEAAEWV